MRSSVSAGFMDLFVRSKKNRKNTKRSQIYSVTNNVAERIRAFSVGLDTQRMENSRIAKMIYAGVLY